MRQKFGLEEPMLEAVFDDRKARESYRSGIKRPHARAELARRWKVGFWTLTNFRRGRLKDLRGTNVPAKKTTSIYFLRGEWFRWTDEMESVQ